MTGKKTKTLYVSDLDGTLLNDSSVLSKETIEKLNTLIAEGALFTIATARTPATAVTIMEKVNTNLPFIVMAGCALWDNKHKDYTTAKIINKEYIPKLIEIFNEHGNNPFVYQRHGNRIIVRHTAEMTAGEKEFITPRLTTPYKGLEITESKKMANNADNVMLLFSMGKFTSLREIANDIDKEGIPCFYNCYHDIFNQDDGLIDLYAEGTTKAQAVTELANKIGAKRIVVFGDNLNDIPMMNAADWSVAVENAFEEVKSQANEVIGKNTDNSVANWIWNDYNKE